MSQPPSSSGRSAWDGPDESGGQAGEQPGQGSSGSSAQGPQYPQWGRPESAASSGADAWGDGSSAGGPSGRQSGAAGQGAGWRAAQGQNGWAQQNQQRGQYPQQNQQYPQQGQWAQQGPQGSSAPGDPYGSWGQEPPRKKHRGLLYGGIGCGVLLALLLVVVLLLALFGMRAVKDLDGDDSTGATSSPSAAGSSASSSDSSGTRTITDVSSMEDAVRSYGQSHGLDECTDVTQAFKGGMSSASAGNLASSMDLHAYACSSGSLSSGSSSNQKVALGLYSKDISDWGQLFTLGQGDLSQLGIDGAYMVQGSHWAVMSNAGTAKEAEKALGGKEWTSGQNT